MFFGSKILRIFKRPESGIYKRKQKSKKTRKQELDQESDQEKKKKLSFFLHHFLCRVLVFFYKFPPGNECPNTQFVDNFVRPPIS